MTYHSISSGFRAVTTPPVNCRGKRSTRGRSLPSSESSSKTKATKRHKKHKRHKREEREESIVFYSTALVPLVLLVPLCGSILLTGRRVQYQPVQFSACRARAASMA